MGLLRLRMIQSAALPLLRASVLGWRRARILSRRGCSAGNGGRGGLLRTGSLCVRGAARVSSWLRLSWANVRLRHWVPAPSRFIHMLRRQRVIPWEAAVVGRFHWIRLAVLQGQVLATLGLGLRRRRWSKACVLRANRIRSLKSTAVQRTRECCSSASIRLPNR